MKTTFKTVFTELDDELMALDMQENTPVDIDVDKIKSEVFMRINGEDKPKKKFSKKIIVILAAAVILVGGTVGAFATGSVQSIFKGYFKGDKVNDLGLYDGGDVQVQSDDFDVKLLGVMSDGEIAYSAIEVTKKDGGDIIEDGYIPTGKLPSFAGVNRTDGESNTYEIFNNNGENSDSEGALVRSRCRLSEDRKTLSIYSDYTRAARSERDLTDFRITYNNNYIEIYKIDKVLYTEDLPEVQSYDKMTEEQIAIENNQQELTVNRLLKENNLTEDECIWITHNGKSVFAKGERKSAGMKFTISFNFNHSIDKIIERNIDSKSSPNVVRDYTRNAKIKISPLSISLSGECDREYDKSMEDWEDRCFISADTDGKSKVIMDDGTVYYVLVNEGGGRRTDDNGVFYETTYLQYSATEEPAIDLASNRIIIDLDKIQSVIINGDTIYQK